MTLVPIGQAGSSDHFTGYGPTMMGLKVAVE